MATDIVMPNLGFDTQEARLVEWVKGVGDSIKSGEVIAVIESDKANVELESIASGTLLEQLFPADTEIKVGAVIARIGQPSEVRATPAPAAIPQAAASPAPTSAKAAPTAEITPLARRVADKNGVDLSKVQGSGTGGRIVRADVEAQLQPPNGNSSGGSPLALPKIRKLAREAGIDLALISATGSAGEITLRDLQAYQSSLEAPELVEETQQLEIALPEGVREIERSRMRQVIGERLAKSKKEAPHFYVTGEFDVEAALGNLKTYREPQPRINDLLQYLVVQTLLRVPELNATFEEKHLFQHGSVNLAIAVALENGLLTPVVHQAEKYSLQGLAAESRAVIGRARDNRMQPQDIQGGTFTVSNLGVIKQVDHFTAVINPPQVAILAVGTVKQRPVVVNGGLHVHHTVHLTLSGDHRVVDGIHLGRFMAVFQEELDKFK
jgi:pyruvate dehydrogenase E2 component (dihydrolipoamide acetyltransferase)